MGLTERLLSWVDTRPARAVLRLTNRLLWLPRPVPVRVHGAKIYAGSFDRLLALLLAKLGRAERYECDLWNDRVRPGMVVADVGANLGMYAILAAKRVGPDGRVHAFEPDPGNFRLLRRGIEANKCSNVVLHQAAVADEVGVIHLHRCAEHHGDHRTYAPAGSGRPTIEVPVTTLDAALADCPRVDVVKMDIQGSEWRAIEGMARLFAGNPGLTLFLEFWPRGLRESGGDAAALLQRFRDLGRRVRHINSGRAALEDLDDAALIAAAEKHGYTNILVEPAGA